MLLIVAELAHRRATTSRSTRSGRSSHIDGAQTVLPQLAVSSRRPTRPSASRSGSPASTPTARTSTRRSRSCATAWRPAGPSARIVAERTDPPARAPARDAGRASRRSWSCRRSPATRSASAWPRVVRDVIRPADQRFLDMLARRVPAHDPRDAGPRLGARRRGALPLRDPRLDHAGPWTRATSTRWASTSSR